MRISDVTVFGFESAMRALRGRGGGWNASDSFIGTCQGRGFSEYTAHHASYCTAQAWRQDLAVPEMPFLGPADLQLARDLVRRSVGSGLMQLVTVTASFSLPMHLCDVWWAQRVGKIGTVCCWCRVPGTDMQPGLTPTATSAQGVITLITNYRALRRLYVGRLEHPAYLVHQPGQDVKMDDAQHELVRADKDIYEWVETLPYAAELLCPDVDCTN